MTISEAASWLRARDGFLILTHKRPDGDTLGSAAALASGLRCAGKAAYLLPNREAAPNLARYVSPYFALADFQPQHILMVDTASEELFPDNASVFIGKVELALDHHISNTNYAKETLVRDSSAACGEIIYDLLLEMGILPDVETVKLLYIAISTDTGCFGYANTTAETLRIASELVKAGAPNGELNKEFFRTKSRSRMALEGMVLESVDFYLGGTTAFVSVTRDMLEKSGADESALDDIAAIPGVIEGVAAGITLKELPDGTTKVSVRTNKTINANRVCAVFGGGGHPMAAGCNIAAPIPEAKRLLLEAVTKELSEVR